MEVGGTIKGGLSASFCCPDSLGSAGQAEPLQRPPGFPRHVRLRLPIRLFATIYPNLQSKPRRSGLLLQLLSRGWIESEGAEADAADSFYAGERRADSQGL